MATDMTSLATGEQRQAFNELAAAVKAAIVDIIRLNTSLTSMVGGGYEVIGQNKAIAEATYDGAKAILDEAIANLNAGWPVGTV